MLGIRLRQDYGGTSNDDTFRHLSGRSVGVLAFRLRHPPSPRLGFGGQETTADKTAGQATRERGAGKTSRVRSQVDPLKMTAITALHFKLHWGTLIA